MYTLQESKFIRALISDYGVVPSQQMKAHSPESHVHHASEIQSPDSETQVTLPHHGCSQDHSREIQIFEKSNDDKLAAIESLRGEGNAYFRAGKYTEAGNSYKLALVYFDYSFPETDAERSAFNSAKLKCHLNMGAALEKLEEWHRVVSECESALILDEKNPKALYRMANAFIRLDDYETGELYLRKVESIEPSDPLVKGLRALLNHKLETYARKERQVATKIFDIASIEDQ